MSRILQSGQVYPAARPAVPFGTPLLFTGRGSRCHRTARGHPHHGPGDLYSGILGLPLCTAARSESRRTASQGLRVSDDITAERRCLVRASNDRGHLLGPHIEWHNDHLWVYWNDAGVFFDCELPPTRGSEPPTIPAGANWDVRVLLDSGSNVHTCPEAWIPPNAVDSVRPASSTDDVLLDVARGPIPCAGRRRTRLGFGGVVSLDVKYVVTPTVDEVILSIGSLLRHGVSIHLDPVGVHDADSLNVQVGTMELGSQRVPVSLSRNTTWVTALSGARLAAPPLRCCHLAGLSAVGRHGR